MQNKSPDAIWKGSLTTVDREKKTLLTQNKKGGTLWGKSVLLCVHARVYVSVCVCVCVSQPEFPTHGNQKLWNARRGWFWGVAGVNLFTVVVT